MTICSTPFSPVGTQEPRNTRSSLSSLPTTSSLPPLNLSVDGLEGPPLGALGERHAQLKELGDDGREVLEEEVVVGGVLLHPLLELLVLDKGHVGGKHHQALGLLVLV